MEPILINDMGWADFLIEVRPDIEYHMDFEVYEAAGWRENGDVVDKELYLKGTIKWDGCSHIWFGSAGDGYIHLCGGGYWEKHNRLMSALYEMAAERIEKWNADLAG